jgi:hypothetical protein
MADSFVAGCESAADLAKEPAMNRDLALSWKLYVTELDCIQKDAIIGNLQVGDSQHVAWHLDGHHT